jgi:acylphosphatase
MSDTGAVHLFARGRVQGVFFRASTQKTAEGLGLTGWVKNCSDGSVEIHAEGDKGKWEELSEGCQQGPPSASVSDIDVDWVDAEGFSSFDVR